MQALHTKADLSPERRRIPEAYGLSVRRRDRAQGPAAHPPKAPTARPRLARSREAGGRVASGSGFDTLSFGTPRSADRGQRTPERVCCNRGFLVTALAGRSVSPERKGVEPGVLADPCCRPGLGEPALSGLFRGRSSGRRSLRTVSPGAFFSGDPRARRPASVAVDGLSRPPHRGSGNARNAPFRGQVRALGGKVSAFCGNPGENFQHPENTPRIAAKKSRRNSHCTGFYSLYAVALQAAAASFVPKRP